MHYARLETAADGIHLHPLPDMAPEALDAEMTRLRGLYGIPADWMEHPDRGEPWTRLPGGGMSPPTGLGWDVAVLEGPLHPSLLEIATVHEEE